MEPIDFSTPSVFANVRSDPDDIDYTAGQRLEIKIYEARYNSKGDRIPLQTGINKNNWQPKDKDHDSALILTRFYDRDRDLEYTQMEVRSPYI